MKLSFLSLLAILTTACAFKGNVVGYIHPPGGGWQDYELTDTNCPEQPSSGELYRVFWVGKTAMGCYNVNSSRQTITFVTAGNRTITGQPERKTYTFAELNAAKDSANAAGNAAILQTFGNRPQPQPVQIQPFSCIRNGAYTTCQ